MWHLTQPLRLVIIIALGNRGPGSSPFLFPFPSHRVETPFRPSPHGLQAPTRSILSFLPFFLPFSLVLQHRPLSLSLSLSLSQDTLVYSFSEPRTSRQVSVIVSRVPRGKESLKKKKKKKGTCPRLGLDRGLWGSLLVFDEIHRPDDGTHCFISHESVTPLVHYDRLG